MNLDKKRQTLLHNACRELISWQKPLIFETIGPFDPSPFDVFDTARNACIQDATTRLMDYSDGQIDILIEKSADDITGTRKDWRSFVDQEVYRLSRRIPVWYAGGFGHPDHRADFDYWAKMAQWTVKELLCLSVGIEPDHFTETQLLGMKKKGAIEKLYPAARFLLRRLEQLERNFGSLTGYERIRPKEFVFWVEKVQFEAPEDFLRLVRTYHVDRSVPPTEPTEVKPADKREIDKISQILTALAIDGYGYDPKQARSPIPKEIADVMASLGLSASDDTVRKYLKIGASHLPSDWKQKTR